MLTLPANFSNDIAGRDTALVPIVKIGDIYISTNSMIYDGNPVLPLLTSNPSLKESIDISTRRYKISNISLTLNNFPYEGQRFSDRVEGSLINTPVEVYWISPSTTTLDDTDTSGLKIYQGQVRRYDMTDTSCKIVVEDRSQATLHKDLPLPENYLTGDEVPDKYKNKPIPMVYGHVDKSPCVISKTIGTSEWGFGEGTINILVDNTIDSEKKGLYIYEDKFYQIQENLHNYAFNSGNNYLFGYPAGTAQLTPEPITNMYTLISQDSNNDPNPISQNLIIGYHQQKLTGEPDELKNIKVKPLRVPSSIPCTFYSTVREDNVFSGTLVDMNDWQGNSYLDSMYGYTDDDIYPGISELICGFDRDKSYVGLLIDPSFSSAGEESVYLMEYRIQLGFGNMTYDTSPTFYHLRIGSSSSGSGEDIVGSATFNSSTPNYDFQYELGEFDIIDLVDGGEILIYLRLSETATDRKGAGSIKINEFITREFSLFKDVINLKYYSEVNGRAMIPIVGELYLSPTAPSAIAHILENELGQGTITLPDAITTGYIYDWEYAFTADKKINSKKLIEGIASASPYIPRFDNMGNFKFNVIPRDGGIADFQIKEADVIDFSFSRTKIEDVYTKIEFKYNWDYARGEFNDSVEADIQDILGENYKFDYYGFKDPETDPDDDDKMIHPDSTLVIDDDRGKYIRKYDYTNTAQEFAEWYLMWSCNQHLKMKIKLPLSKGLELEIGDFVDFDAILGGVKPYGIDYISDGQGVNAQEIFKNFLIVSTNKNLEFCEIECIQMHDLESRIPQYTTFNADIFYGVTASSELDGVLVENIYGEFPELENLTDIQGVGEASQYVEGTGWVGSLTELEGGNIYDIKFSQETTTNLFQLND